MVNAAVTSCQCGCALPQGLGGVRAEQGARVSRAGLSGPLCADLAVHRPVSNGEFGGRASWREGLPGDECMVRDLEGSLVHGKATFDDGLNCFPINWAARGAEAGKMFCGEGRVWGCRDPCVLNFPWCGLFLVFALLGEQPQDVGFGW